MSDSAQTSSPQIQVRRLRPNDDSDIPLPRYMTPHASGMDLCAAVADEQVIDVGAIGVIPTGIAMAIPPGFEVQVRPRSGLGFKHGLSIINSPGTIDADYRGEIRVALINLGDRAYVVRRGDRIAQLVVQRVYHARLKVVEVLEETERNDGGFGHTGI